MEIRKEKLTWIKVFSQKLFILRNETGISARELAKGINVPTNTIYLWESNKRIPALKSIIKLSDFFKVPLDYWRK